MHLNYGFLHATYGYLQKATVNLLFNTDRGLEKIYDTVFSFLGWEGNISNSSGPLYGLWYFFQFMGWSLLALGLLIVAFQSLMHRSDWGKIGTNVVLAAMTMTLLPMMMQMFNTVAVDAESAIKSVKGTEMTTDIAVQPIKNNVIDLSTLIRRDFGNFKYKPEAKKIRNVANWNVINSAKDVKEMDFGQYLDKKTDVNQLLKESQKTPLMLAATLPEYEDVMKMSKLLLKYGADAKQEDSHGANVLFYTVYHEYETRSSEDNHKILEFYMEKGASPDITIRNFDAEYNGFEENGGTNLTLVEYCQKKGMDKEAEYLKERSSNH